MSTRRKILNGLLAGLPSFLFLLFGIQKDTAWIKLLHWKSMILVWRIKF